MIVFTYKTFDARIVSNRSMADLKNDLTSIVDSFDEAAIHWQSDTGVIFEFKSTDDMLDLQFRVINHSTRIGLLEGQGNRLSLLWYIDSQSTDCIIDSIKRMATSLHLYL